MHCWMRWITEARTYIVPLVQLALSQECCCSHDLGLGRHHSLGLSSLFALITLPVEFNAVRGRKNYSAMASSEAMSK
jgi:Zn-dependent membrane protease YugP